MGDYRDEREAALKRAENLAQENAQLHSELDALRGNNTSARSTGGGRATTRMPWVLAVAIGTLVLAGAGAGFFLAVRPMPPPASANVLQLRGHWSPPAPVAQVPLRGAVRSGSGTWAVGDRGTTLFRTEPQGPWTPIPSGTGANLRAIVGGAYLIAVGDRGTALRFDADQRRWIAEDTHTTADLRAVTVSNGVLFAAGSGGTVLKRDITGAWTAIASGVTVDLHGIVASPTDYTITAVGDGGTIVSGPSSATALHSQASPTTANLRAVSAWNGNLLAVGDRGVMVATSDRSPWVVVNSGQTADLFVVGAVEIPYEERRENFSGSGSSTGFIAAGAGGAVLVERLGSTAGWRPVRAGGAAVRAMVADPWTFFTDDGTAIEFDGR